MQFLLPPLAAQPSWLALTLMADHLGICTLTTPTGRHKHSFLTFLGDPIATKVWSLCRFEYQYKSQLVAAHNVAEKRIGSLQGPNAEKVAPETTKFSIPKTPSALDLQRSIRDQGWKIVNFLKQLGIETPVLRRCLRHASQLSEPDFMKLMATLRHLGLKRAELRSLLSKRPSLISMKATQIECMFRYFLGLGFNNAKTIRIWMHCPALIHYDLENVKEMVNYLASIGMQTEEIPDILSRKPKILEHELARVKYTVCSLLNTGISHMDIVTLLKRAPDIFYSSGEENVNASLSFWLSLDVEGKALYKALIRRPNLLNYDIEKMKASYQFIQGWMEPGDLRNLLRKYPEVLSFDSRRKLEPLIMHLLGLGVRGEKLGKIIARRPQLLACTISGLDKTVIYLKSLGVKDDMFGKIITISPQVV